MKAISSGGGRGIQTGSLLKCIDNSGAHVLKVISVRGFKGIRKARPTAGIADPVMCRVKRGTEKVRNQVFKAVVVRQKKEYRRASGMRVQFEDNAAVLVGDNFEPTGTLVKGPVAREVVERFKIIGKVANVIV